MIVFFNKRNRNHNVEEETGTVFTDFNRECTEKKEIEYEPPPAGQVADYSEFL